MTPDQLAGETGSAARLAPGGAKPLLPEERARLLELAKALASWGECTDPAVPTFTMAEGAEAIVSLLQAITEAEGERDEAREKADHAGVCEGCGSSRSLKSLQADGYLGCCPERKMLSAKEWAKRAQSAESQLASIKERGEKLAEALRPFASQAGNPDFDNSRFAAARRALASWSSPLEGEG